MSVRDFDYLFQRVLVFEFAERIDETLGALSARSRDYAVHSYRFVGRKLFIKRYAAILLGAPCLCVLKFEILYTLFKALAMRIHFAVENNVFTFDFSEIENIIVDFLLALDVRQYAVGVKPLSRALHAVLEFYHFPLFGGFIQYLRAAKVKPAAHSQIIG